MSARPLSPERPYDAGRRGDHLFVDPAVIRGRAGLHPPVPELPRTRAAIEEAQETKTDSEAVWAQARLVRRRSEQLREQARQHHPRVL